MKIRSKLIAALLLASTMLISGHRKAADAPKAEDAAAAGRKNFIAALKDLGKKYKYIILGDTDHSAVEIKELMADLDVLKTLSDNGFKVIIKEGPVSENQEYDPAKFESTSAEMPPPTLATYFNKICQQGEKPETLASKKENTISFFNSENPELSYRMSLAYFRLLANTCNTGMKIFYPDEHMEAFYEDPPMVAYFSHTAGSSTDNVANDTIYSDTELMVTPFLRPVAARLFDFFNDRTSEKTNRKITSNALKFSENKKILFLYGWGHLRQKYDIDEMLGQDQTVTIALLSKKDSSVGSGIGGPGSIDLPQYYYIIENDEMVAAQPGQKSGDAFLAKYKNGFTREEYDEGIKALPEAWRRFALPYTEYDADPSNNTLPKNWLRLEPTHPIFSKTLQ
jgi:hypothetical protein